MPQVPESFCEKCGTCLDGAHHAEDRKQMPEAGMLSVCAYCLNVTVYDESLRLVPPTPELLADPEVQKLIADTIEYIKTLPFGGKPPR